jgi:hypothetical protein
MIMPAPDKPAENIDAILRLEKERSNPSPPTTGYSTQSVRSSAPSNSFSLSVLL